MEDTIFTTGAFLKAVEVEINGIKQWRWVAEDFTDENFQGGKSIDVYTYADNLKDLICCKNSTFESVLN